MIATVVIQHTIDPDGPDCGTCRHLRLRRIDSGYSPSAGECLLFGEAVEHGARCLGCLAARPDEVCHAERE